MGVALWYCPPINSAIYDTLKSLILSLQTLFPESMLLEPHITLTSQLRCETEDDISAILTAANAAVKSIKPRLEASKQLMVNFDSVKIGKKYFEKVRLCCKEDKYLYGIAQVIRELFVLATPDPKMSREWVLTSFEPHLSLVYSDVYHVDQALQRVIQQRIEDALGIVLARDQAADANNQCVWRLEQPLEGWSLPGTFKLVRCEGPVQTWQVLGATDV